VRVSILAILAAILASSACVLSAAQVPTATPTVSPPPASPTPTPAPTATERPKAVEEDVQTVTIRAVVYIRAEADPNSQDLGALETGAKVPALECVGEWCKIETEIDGETVTGYVFRGCTSDNPDGLLCEVR
jgi:hypothetical protein